MDSLGDFAIDNDKNCHIRKTNICELRAFYGLSYARGAQNTNLTDAHKLWSESTFGHPIYGACLSRHRYSFLRQNITFDDVTTRDMRWRTDRFAALRMFFQAANDNFSRHMQPPEYLTVDETLYATRTDIAFRQYNPSKPARYGILLKSINAAQIPYTFLSTVYAGRPVGEPGPYYIKGITATVKAMVEQLSRFVELDGRNITTDRLYTSYQLTNWLLSKNITTTGTLMSNKKGIPKHLLSVTDRDTPSCEVLYDTNTEGRVSLHSYVVSTKGNQKKNILLMCSQPPLIGVTKDDSKKPAIYKFYDYTKGGTDQVDYRLAANTVRTKSKRWTMTGFSYIMDTMRVNAQTIVALNTGVCPTSTNSTEFCWDLALALAKPHMRRRRERGGLQGRIKRNIDFIIGANNEPVIQQMPQQNATKRRCAYCVSAIEGPGFKKRKDNLPKHVTCCTTCHRTLCKAHCVLYCSACDPAIRD